MQAERWGVVESLYHSALGRKPHERRAFLESACGSDEALRHEVESLLDVDDLAASFLETSRPEVPRQPAGPPLPAGERIGPYLVVEFLRAGGMGEVYKALDTRLDRTVAIKFLPRALAADPAALERFQREARAASALNHPRICTIHDLGEHQGRPFFVMEFLEGESLRDRIAGKPVPLVTFVDFGVQIADALQAAHTKGIVHRDVKPGNIFVTPAGLIKVLDFGLAKLGPEPRSAAAADDAAAIDSTVTGITLTRPGSTMGTLTYLSPEQARGEEVDARTDIFSFGIVLYEMATGRPAFRAETSAELLAAILREQPPKPSSLNRAVPGGLERIILKMLEKDRTARYQAVAEVLADLEAFQQAAAAAPRTRRWLLGSSAAALVTLAGGALLTRPSFFSPQRKVTVAVLPLENLDGDQKQAWFADGLHEEMISILGRLYPDGLRVIARTSVKQYHGTNRRIDQIGRDLKVDYVVEGGVRREGNSVRITAHLIRAKDQTQLWNATYDRDLRQVLALQAEVANAVALGIERSLRPSVQVQLALARPLDPQAHEAYLRRDYAKAVRIDPNYASAWAALAGSTGMAAQFGSIPPIRGFTEAREAASNALELDPTLASAHATLALARAHGEWKWREGEEGMRRALELNPGDGWVRHIFAHFLLYENRSKESAEECDRAFEYDPFDPDMVVCAAWHEAWAGDYDKALASIRRAFSIQAENKGAMLIVGWAYEQKGMYPEAVSAMEKFYPSSARTASMAHALALWGKRDAAEHSSHSFSKTRRRNMCPPMTSPSFTPASAIATAHSSG